MSVNAETPIQSSTANGVATSFPFAFTLLDAADLVVKGSLGGVVTTYALGTDYSITGVGTNAGSVEFVAAPANGAVITRFRDSVIQRLTDYQDNGDLPAGTVNLDFDRLWLVLQEIFNGGKGSPTSLRVPDGESVPELASASARANKTLGFDSSGNPTVLTPVVGSAASVLTDLADTTTPTKNSFLVGWLRAAAAAVATTVKSWIDWQSVHVYEFMTVAQIASVQARNNVQDVTAALTAAIAAAGDNKRLLWGEGSYKITAGLTLATNRTHWVGAGRFATQIYYAPTVAGTALTLGALGSTKTLGRISGIGFYSDDSTVKKVAIDCIDLSNWVLEDIGINGGVVASSTMFWSGAGSVGLRVRGKELTGVRDLFIAADFPIQISVNPNLAGISIDHWNFHNCYFLANANPHVSIDTGVNLTQVSFSGFQSWALGTAGVKWTDTTSTLVSNGLVLENVRAEQGTDATAYLVDISHNTGMQGLTLRNCYGGIDRKMAKLRNVSRVLFDTHTHAGTLETLDVDATVKGMELRNCFWQAGATASLVGQRLVWGAPLNPNTAPLPPFAVYDESANAGKTSTTEAAISGASVTLANNATLALGANISGDVAVMTSEGFGAVYYCHGAQNAVDLVAGTISSAFFSNALTTAAKVNLGFTGGQYTIENKRGATIRVKVTVRGSYGAI